MVAPSSSMLCVIVIASTALVSLVLTPSTCSIYCDDEDNCYYSHSKTADCSEIKKAYYKLSLKHRPVKEVKILPKQLKISWDNNPVYWHFYENDNQSEEPCYAELLKVYWLEIIGKFERMSRNKKYSVGFTISFKEDSFGWYDRPLYMMAKVGRNGKEIWKKINLNPYNRGTSVFNIPESDKLIVETNHDEYDIYLGLYETQSGQLKGGLKIYYAFAQLV